MDWFALFLVGICCFAVGFAAGLISGAVTGEPIDDKAAEKIKRQRVKEFIQKIVNDTRFW